VPRIITYEQPLNERIRSFLRLESLFRQAEHFLSGASPWNSQAALTSILDIQNLLSRSDLKTEVLKELERHTANLARLEQNPDVDRRRLTEILDELDGLIDRLYSSSQPLGHELKQNEFLNSIRQRLAIPGGTCVFDLPAYHHWLQQTDTQRAADLQQWLTYYEGLRHAIDVVLHLVRESATSRNELAVDGFFQKTLDPNTPCQMLRIGIAHDRECFPEVSGGKHRFTIRFMQQDSPNDKATPTQDDVEFRLTCCMM
jgi:cell division protein ZapD